MGCVIALLPLVFVTSEATIEPNLREYGDGVCAGVLVNVVDPFGDPDFAAGGAGSVRNGTVDRVVRGAPRLPILVCRSLRDVANAGAAVRAAVAPRAVAIAGHALGVRVRAIFRQAFIVAARIEPMGVAVNARTGRVRHAALTLVAGSAGSARFATAARFTGSARVASGACAAPSPHIACTARVTAAARHARAARGARRYLSTRGNLTRGARRARRYLSARGNLTRGTRGARRRLSAKRCLPRRASLPACRHAPRARGVPRSASSRATEGGPARAVRGGTSGAGAGLWFPAIPRRAVLAARFTGATATDNERQQTRSTRGRSAPPARFSS